MDSGWFLLLELSAVVLLQAELTGGQDDLRVLLQQLMVRVDRLERDRGTAQVAFSASLVNTSLESRFQGPHDTDTRLVFEKVTTNIGNGYNANTGIFSAPIDGLYYIHFTRMTGNSKSMHTALMKNSENMFAVQDTVGPHSSTSNGMTLVLEQDDRLWITLLKNSSIFDQGRLSTFNGCAEISG
uniref:C1q domain-containing protein n=1 Tax=Oreochromis niloticus TaxID=8128 RepID=A0A669BB56_ORENI